MVPRLLLALPLVAVVGVPVAFAQDERPQAGYFSCMTMSDDNHSTVYLTPLFETTAVRQEVSNGFGQVLVQKYHYKDRIFCSRANLGTGIKEKLDGDRVRYLAQLKGAGKTVVETGYIFDPDKTLLAFACSGFTRHLSGTTKVDSAFLSQVFRVPSRIAGPMGVAWFNYLVAEHHADPLYPGSCHMLPPDPADHAAIIAELPKAWGSPSPVITRLDWQYDPAAAAAQATDDAKPAYYCEMTGSKPKTWYTTAVIPAAPDFPRYEAQLEWGKWLRANLDADAYSGGCDQGTTRHEMSLRENRIDGYKNQGYTVKEVSWTYTGSAAPTTTPAPAPVPAPPPPTSTPSVGFPQQVPPTPYYCQFMGFSPDAQGKYPLYQNEVFTAAVRQRELQQAWGKYLESTYHVGQNGNATCAQLPTDPAQQKTVLQGMMAIPQTTMKVIKVTWKP